jgi:methylmalonyl-CoA mutase C-terminal domain/subunit
MEVVYTGPWQEISAVVALTLEEDIDVVGVSSLAADHLIVPKLMHALRAADLEHVRVVVGGIVPDEEELLLLDAGVSELFHPGSSRDEIVGAFHRLCVESRARRPEF